MEAAEQRERERYRERERERKRPQKKRKKSFAFGSLTYVKAREAELLAKAMNVGALFAFIWFPGKKQPTNNRASDIKKSN